jgi:thioredoxin-like negative regulator of GroEL
MEVSTVLLLIASAIPTVGTWEYDVAYQRAMEGDEPLLVFVTADWCGTCQQMKATTIEDMISQNKFDGFHFAIVDLVRQPQLGNRLLKTQVVPQLIAMQKEPVGWTARRLRGVQSEATVEAFLDMSRRGGQPAKVALSR